MNTELKKKFGPKAIGQVVRILSEDTLIIDVGKDRYIKEGDKIQVYEYLGDLNGVNGEFLGSFEGIKAELTVKRVEPKYSICQTATYKTSALDWPRTPLLENIVETKHYALDVDEKDISPLEIKDPKIHIGDPVKRP